MTGYLKSLKRVVTTDRINPIATPQWLHFYIIISKKFVKIINQKIIQIIGKVKKGFKYNRLNLRNQIEVLTVILFFNISFHAFANFPERF